MQTAETQLPDAKWLKTFRRQILKWYEKHARVLPWRGTGCCAGGTACCAGGTVDPYRVWVSEIMLQQTTTAAVEGYYHRFLDRFPNVRILADASDSEVLRYWEGLGYYRRATQLHRASKMIVSEYGGAFPNTFEEVLSLPGIGRYTAGAICSIAYHQRTPILEANTIRLHARLLAYPDDPAKSAGSKLLWQMAERVLPPVSHPDRTNGSRERSGTPRSDRIIPRSIRSLRYDPVTALRSVPGYHWNTTTGCSSPGQFNQALMDLGSMVCTPKSPDCANCPVAALCRCAEKGLQHVIPVLKKEKNIEERTEVALVIKKGEKYLMMRYPQDVRWAGLWDFPRYELNSDVARHDIEEYCHFRKNIQRLTGYHVVLHDQVGEFRHVVTRYKITLKVFRAQTVGRKICEEKYQTEWVPKHALADLALSTTGRKIVEGIIKFSSGVFSSPG